MGQVPDEKIQYGIIGKGRVAKHFLHYLQALHLPVIQWHRQLSIAPEVALNNCQVILVLISDRSIEEFIQAHPQLTKKILVHFSGSLVTPLAQGLHPLMTFSTELYDLEDYQKIHFVGEKEGQHSFEELFPQLPNTHSVIPQSERSRYHALCVLANNFTSALWQKFFLELDNYQLPPQAGEEFLTRTYKNILINPRQIASGPVARGDTKTIQKNISALNQDPYADVYRAFVKAFQSAQKKEAVHERH